ncbi:sensor histidine kinase [Chitinophaga defluvii]|uniref:Histidine kinase n=1 Tax=Chitinophaga defluvii TaxID=3163343 RepID=A0ABV2TBU8_9BACT
MIFSWVIGVFILVVLAVSGYRLYQERAALMTEVAAQRTLVSQQCEQIAEMNIMLKMKVLQARLNPHFLFNSLNAIQYFITADDKKASLQYISRFAGFLRKTIHFGDELAIHLQDEAELIKDYLVLEQFRFPDRFEYEIDLPEELHLERIPPFLTHGLLEEALYKGVLHLGKEEKGKIAVVLRAHAEGLALEVTDNGASGTFVQGMEERAALFSRRIQLFNEQHHRKIRLEHRKEVMEGGIALNRAVIIIG